MVEEAVEKGLTDRSEERRAKADFFTAPKTGMQVYWEATVRLQKQSKIIWNFKQKINLTYILKPKVVLV